MAIVQNPSKMEKYRRVQNKKSEESQSRDDEIRITAKGRTATYVSYAGKLFNDKEMKEFTLKATGAALATAVTVAEVIKRRFKGLHQITKLGSVEVVDEWEPLEEGLEPMNSTRSVSFIEIVLSKEPLDKDDKGYQEPLDESLVKEVDPDELQKKPEGAAKKPKGGAKKGKGKGKAKGEGEAKEGGKGKKGKKGKGKRSSKGKGKREKKEKEGEE